MNLQSNDFELFDLPMAFALDRGALDARWKDLQREVHPDRHAAADAQTQRQAMQWSVRINEAYQRLKDPIKRAAYLCELRGAPIDAERNTAMPADFLQQQLVWREALDDAGVAGQGLPAGGVGGQAVFGEVDARQLAEWVLADRLPVRFQLQMHEQIWAPDMRGV